MTLQTDTESKMRCWICGDEAKTGEHMIKASDLKSLFGNVTQKSPLHFHTGLKRNQPIPGIKSAKLKHQAHLCAHCNNEITQPHDRAWERLSTYLQNRQPSIRPGMQVRLNRIFPGSVSKSMLNVHLYFLKLFGCLITEKTIPIEIDQFAKSILNGIPHPKVWIALCTGLHHQSIKHVGYSDVEMLLVDGRVTYASWFYVVDKVAINITFAEPSEYRKGLVHAWCPSKIGKRIRVVGY